MVQNNNGVYVLAIDDDSSNGGRVQAVRGSKLGKKFTVAGINEYMKQKEKENGFEYLRQEQDIEYSSQSMKDYSKWEEDSSLYEAFDQFTGKDPDFKLPLKFTGSKFQNEVWEIFYKIPYGKTMTYGEIAKELAKHREISRMSAQAVGGAVGKGENLGWRILQKKNIVI